MIDKKCNKTEQKNSKKQIKFKKRNCNSSNKIIIKKGNNHSGGKIILSLQENSVKKKRRKKIRTFNYYIIMIQSFWRGFTFRKLMKIIKELLLLFIPFINNIKKIFNKYKKIYYSYFLNEIKKSLTRSIANYKNYSFNNSIKKNASKIYNIKKNKFIKPNSNIICLVNKNKNLRKHKYNNEKTKDRINNIKNINIDNIFYHKKKLSLNKEKNNKNILYYNRKEMTGPNLNNIDCNNISNRRMIKRTTFKKFNNISPDFRNIQLNIKNSLKKSLMEQNNNLNNYSSSVSIFFQTQLPEIKKNAFKNFVYISKNKKTKNNPKNEILERIKNKIINNFYLTLCKCIKKSIYKYYLHHFVFYLNTIEIAF
jgi:hypothetical protein